MDSIAKRYPDTDRIEEIYDAAPCTQWKEQGKWENT